MLTATRSVPQTAIYDLGIACDIINGITYKPGWTIKSDPNGQYEQGINLTFIFPAVDADRSQAPAFDKPLNIPGLPSGFQYTQHTIICDGCTEVELLRKVMDEILKCEIHEAREFFRSGIAYDAPFHPHHIAGMHNWGEMERDIAFGIVRG